MSIRLVEPSIEYEQAILAYKCECTTIDRLPTVNGSGGLELFDDINGWLGALKLNQNVLTVANNQVPSTTFLAVNCENVLIGMINIRHTVDEFVLTYGGQIGYSIRPSQRNRGFGTQMLHLGIEELKRISQEKRMIITVRKNNLPSRKIILANGGVLEDEVEFEGQIRERYWINLE